VTRGRLGRYAVYQLGDYAIERGLLLALLLAFLAWGNVFSSRMLMGPGWASGVEGQMRAATLFDSLLTLLGYAGALLGVNGISSNDRQRGRFRLLFSRPIRVDAYYAQSFLVIGSGLLVVTALVTAGFSMFVAQQSMVGAISSVALCWMVVGGLGFLLSAITRFDGSLLLLLMLVAALLNGYLGAAGTVGAKVHWLLTPLRYLLPPMHLLGDARGTLMQGLAVGGRELAWMIGFGAICIVAGLVVLRRRPLAT
jgi:hypothetical protein